MAYRFDKHYTREEARALLPQIRLWLGRLTHLRSVLQQQEIRIQGLMSPGSDLGGSLVNNWLRTLVEIRELGLEFEQRQIQIKDLDRGLLDFPALIAGREVFLCWEKDDEDIEFWHELDSGYAGRERL